MAGAPGGVGTFAVQFAAARGAYVIATAASRAEDEHVRSVGAADTVHPGAIAEAVRSVAPRGVQAVAHAAGDAAILARLLAPGGRFASTLGVGPEQLAGLPITATSRDGLDAERL